MFAVSHSLIYKVLSCPSTHFVLITTRGRNHLAWKGQSRKRLSGLYILPQTEWYLCQAMVGLSADWQFLCLKRKALNVPSSLSRVTLGEPFCSGFKPPSSQQGGLRHLFELEGILAFPSFFHLGTLRLGEAKQPVQGHIQSDIPGFLVYSYLDHSTPEFLASVSAKVLEASAHSL